MDKNSLPIDQQSQYTVNYQSDQIEFHQEQDKLYKSLLTTVQKTTPEETLIEFKRLFIDCLDQTQEDHHAAGVYTIFDEGREQDFYLTIKRCCYILINNWDTSKQNEYIHKLIEILENYKQESKNTVVSNKNMYHVWLTRFINSQDYEDLKIFISKYKQEKQKSPDRNWTKRYSAYLLSAQAQDEDNSWEEREAVKKLSQQLKDKFKFDLAMYIAYSQSSAKNKQYKNPTILGHEVLTLIKIIINKKGNLSYKNLAKIFIQQTENQTLAEFKHNLYKYLFFSFTDHSQTIRATKDILEKTLLEWNTKADEEIINSSFRLRICNRLIDILTAENNQEPTELFQLFLVRKKALVLVILFIKIVLICPNSRTHLELRIAQLITYYQKYPLHECEWLINFLEIFNIAFAIYSENVEYTLINMRNNEEKIHAKVNLDDYRIFSQLKLEPLEDQ